MDITVDLLLGALVALKSVTAYWHWQARRGRTSPGPRAKIKHLACASTDSINGPEDR